MNSFSQLNTQFYVQLVNRPDFGSGILLFGQLEKKVDLRNPEQLLRVVFSTFCGDLFFFSFSKKYFSIHIEKLHRMTFVFFFLFLLKKLKK